MHEIFNAKYGQPPNYVILLCAPVKNLHNFQYQCHEHCTLSLHSIATLHIKLYIGHFIASCVKPIIKMKSAPRISYVCQYASLRARSSMCICHLYVILCGIRTNTIIFHLATNLQITGCEKRSNTWREVPRAAASIITYLLWRTHTMLQCALQI